MQDIVIVFLFLLISSYSVSIVNSWGQQVAVAQSLPPIESLPPEQNPFMPVMVRGLGEIDTTNTDGDRISVYISAPQGTGNVKLYVCPLTIALETCNPAVTKTFNLDTRIAYSKNAGPDQYGYYTVRVPALLYSGVASIGSFEVCLEVIGTDNVKCERGSSSFPGGPGPARVDITID